MISMLRWPCVPKPWPGATRSSLMHAQRAEVHVVRVEVVGEREAVVGVRASRGRRGRDPALRRMTFMGLDCTDTEEAHMKMFNQVGFIGLGRMGANMVQRLAGAGIRCVAFDANPAAVQAAGGARRHRHRFAAGVRGKARGATRHLAHVAGGGRRPGTRRTSSRCCRRATSSSTAAIPTIATTCAAARSWRGRGIHYLGRRHQRRHRGRRARLLPDDRRARSRRCDAARADFRGAGARRRLAIRGAARDAARRAATCTAARMAPATS